MKKLTLDVDQLSVQSFETQAAQTPRGTVQAHASEPWRTCESGNVSYPGTCEPVTCVADTCNPEPTGDCPPGTWRPSCEYTAPDPEGTCCGLTC